MTDRPRFKRGAGPDQLPYGGVERLNEREVPAVPEVAPAVPEIPVTGRSREAPTTTGDLAGFDDFVFGPTERPGEPVTEGAPFGPGSAFLPRPQESDDEFIHRVAFELFDTPGASSRVKAYAARVLSGE